MDKAKQMLGKLGLTISEAAEDHPVTVGAVAVVAVILFVLSWIL